MKKRFLTLALVLAMCLSLAVPAFAAANSTAKPEDKDPVATESAKPEDKDPEASDSTEPEDKDPEASDSAEPEDKDPEASDSAEPEGKDPEPTESTDPVKPAPEFTDVPADIFFEEPVKWALEKDITNGTSATKFSPAEDCSQVQILTFLFRAAREDGKASSADDLELAVEWAKEKDIIDDTFDGSKPCTRGTAASYIWKAFGTPEVEVNEVLTDVAEADAVAVSWMLEQKITNGTSEAPFLFSPDQVCNRGEIVTFLYRAYAAEDETPAEG